MEVLRSALLRRRGAVRSAVVSSTRWARAEASAVRGFATQPHGDSPEAPKAAVPTPIATAMALAEQLEHPESSRIGRSLLSRPNWTPDAAGSGLTREELKRARQCLESLRDRVERECEEGPNARPSTEQQRFARREKATKRRLGRMLVALMRQGNYKDVEGVAFLWDDVFPQYSRNSNHWGVICEHYAAALNKQRRYSEVVEKLFTNWLVSLEEEDAETAKGVLAAQWSLAPTVPALLLACGHLKDAETATRILRIAHSSGIEVTTSALFELLDAMIRDDPLENFEAALQVCDVIVNELGGNVPLWIQPRLIKAAAERGEIQRAMQYYSHPPYASVNGYAALHFDVCLLTLWDLRCVDEMLIILQNLVDSKEASRELKERICKGLLRKSVEERKEDCREQAMQVTIAVLDLMEKHHIRASNKPFTLLLTTLVEDKHIDSVEGFVQFFAKYPHVMEWNAFMICELLLVAVRLKQVKLIDDLVAHALNTGIPLKYVALESVVAYYYRTGKFDSVEKAADIIRALRKNKDIPLGMALSEIGMVCNSKLGRSEEVVLLFEDFAKLDGERKRVLTRKPMLKAAVSAYTKLKRYDEANALRQLLDLHHETHAEGVDEDSDSDSDDEDGLTDDESEHIRAQSI